MSYSYSASFAVALSGRRIAAVRRIWADGKLLRGAAGDFKTETGFRLYLGGEDQVADPLIAAAEGIGDAPAFRGLAYAMFENFQLGDYGNRIPSLTFEVVADADGTTTGVIVDAIASGAVIATAGTALGGFAAHGDSVRAVIATLDEAVPEPLYDDGSSLRLGVDGAADVVLDAGPVAAATRSAAGQVPDAVSIGYYDPRRDYQAGLQQASFGGPGRRVQRVALPATLEAGAAKALAAARLGHHWRTRERRTVTLPFRHMGLRPGQVVRLGPGERRWLVSAVTLERMAVKLDLVAHGGGGPMSLPAVPGRAQGGNDWLHGATALHLFDAPGLGEAIEAQPRLLIAAAGAERGWRGAVLEASSDGGASWQAAGMTAGRAVIGRTLDVLAAGGSTLFDMAASVEVELLATSMELESRDDDALVAGDSLAMIGDELVQFGRAEMTGPRRFRLSRLLRGRRGSEWAAAAHVAGEAFTLIEAETLVALPVPAALSGGVMEVAARGTGDAEPTVGAAMIGVEAVRPPAPVHLRAAPDADGSVVVTWTRRSRTGWAWIDAIDAPLGEPGEAYRVTIAGGGATRSADVTQPRLAYTAAQRAADGVAAGSIVTISVEQVGAQAVSRPAAIEFTT